MWGNVCDEGDVAKWRIRYDNYQKDLRFLKDKKEKDCLEKSNDEDKMNNFNVWGDHVHSREI